MPAIPWSEAVSRAGAELDPLVREALQSLGRARWRDGPSGNWRVLAEPERATWALARHLGVDASGHHRYERIQVVASVDPQGRLVTWQINNGAEFLGLTDLTPYGLQRGVTYLLNEEYREWVTDTPLFDVEPEVRGVRRLWRRIRRASGS